MTSPLACLAAVALSTSLTLCLAPPAQAAKVPPTRTADDGVDDVNGTDDGSTYEERVNRARTDLEEVAFYTTELDEARFSLVLGEDVYVEVEGTSYTRSVVAKAVDYKYKRVDGRRKIVKRVPYTTRFTSVSTAEQPAVAERLVDGGWEVLDDCFVEAAPVASGSADYFWFTFDASCFGRSIDYMTSEWRTSTVDVDGQTWTDFAALGPVNP